jgi:hypothetical protein
LVLVDSQQNIASLQPFNLRMPVVLRDSAHNDLATCIDLQNQGDTVKVRDIPRTLEFEVCHSIWIVEIQTELAKIAAGRSSAKTRRFSLLYDGNS